MIRVSAFLWRRPIAAANEIRSMNGGYETRKGRLVIIVMRPR